MEGDHDKHERIKTKGGSRQTERMLLTDRRTPTVRRIMRDRNIRTGRRIIMTDRG